MATRTLEQQTGDFAPPPEAGMYSHSEPPKPSCGISSSDAFKIGGTTVGSIAIGTAIGSIFSPVGAITGAVIAGIAGAAFSTAEARTHGKGQ